MPSYIPRHHSTVIKIVKFFKEQKAITSKKFLQLINHLGKSQSVTSKKQTEFNFFLEITHQEYFRDNASSSDPNVKFLILETYIEKIVKQIVGRFQDYL